MIKYRKWKIILLVPSILWAVIILYLSVTPMPDKEMPFPLYDKVLHLAAFALLSFLMAIPRLPKRAGVRMLIIPIAFGALIEIVQFFVPARQMDILDWVADILGSATAFALFVFIAFLIKRFQAGKPQDTVRV